MAFDFSEWRLRVDGEGVRRVILPYCIDVILPVVFKISCIDALVVIRRENPHWIACVADDTHCNPEIAVVGGLVKQTLAEIVDGVCSETLCDLGLAAVFGGEHHAEDEADKVDVADVCVEGAVFEKCELDEAPVEGGAWVMEVVDGGLDEAVTALAEVDHEKFEVPFGEVDSSGGEGRGDVNGEGLAFWREGDGEIVFDLDGRGAVAGMGVDEGAIGGDEDDGAVGVEALDVGVDWAAVVIVVQFEGQFMCADGVVPSMWFWFEYAVVAGAVESVEACYDYIFDAAWLGDGEASFVRDGCVEAERRYNAYECSDRNWTMHVEMHGEML